MKLGLARREAGEEGGRGEGKFPKQATQGFARDKVHEAVFLFPHFYLNLAKKTVLSR